MFRRAKKEWAIAVGKRLKEIRYTLRWDTSQMAKKLQISQSAYYKNENGDSMPGAFSLDVLQDDLDISMDWLLYGKGPMYYRDKHALSKELTEKIQSLKKDLPGLMDLLQKMS